MILAAGHVSVSVPVLEMSAVGAAGRLATAQAEASGFSKADIDRVALVVAEAGNNLVLHGGGGELLLRSWASKSAVRSLEILALDHGPGMANFTASLRGGAAASAGSSKGLAAIQRLSTAFDVFSAPGKGTVLLSRIDSGPALPAAGSGLWWGAVCVARLEEEVTGDAWAVQEREGFATLLVVDGLGHGLHAFDAAAQALRTFWQSPEASPEPLLRALDSSLKGTRGVAAAVAEFDWAKRELHFAGVGNISASLFTPDAKTRSLVSHNGTAGQSIDRIQEFIHPWPEGGLLVMHSDGLSFRWDLDAYPGLSQKDPSLIAAVLYRDFARRQDDAVVVVARERVREQPGEAP